jgi:hypothetical protein
VYEKLGTHAIVRDELVEDLALARAIKRDGRFRLFLAGSHLVRVRWYRGFGEIWRGFERNTFAVTRRRPGLLAFAFVFASLLSWVPLLVAVAALARRRPRVALEAFAVNVATVLLVMAACRPLALQRRYALTAPLGLGVFSAIAGTVLARRALGMGVQWRGRSYGG